MSSTTILSESTSEGVLILTMNDPATRNALSEEMLSELVSEVKRFSESPDLRALIVTGAGTSFSSGANVRSLAQLIEEDEQADEGMPDRSDPPWYQLDPVYTMRETGDFSVGHEIVGLLHHLQKPSIAAVNGHAYGLGCGIALSCDFRVAAESARFNEAFIRNGLVPADGSAWQLPKLVGLSNALWMQYSGESVDGREAYRIGLANAVTEDDDLMSHSLEMATKLAKGPVFAMGLVKQLVHQGYHQTFSEHLPLAFRAQALTRKTFDHKEGVSAFLEKRPPEFEGR